MFGHGNDVRRDIRKNSMVDYLRSSGSRYLIEFPIFCANEKLGESRCND